MASRPARAAKPAPAAPPAAAPEPIGRQMRLVAAVVAATTVVWLFANWAGAFYGWPARLAFLFDFLALAAFAWALIVTYRLRRARRAPGAK